MTDGRTREHVRKTILQSIEDADVDPVPISDVVDDAIVKHPANAVFRAFADLIRQGEVYEPRTNHVRRTPGTGRQ
jgi:hypothetical protein